MGATGSAECCQRTGPGCAPDTACQPACGSGGSGGPDPDAQREAVYLHTTLEACASLEESLATKHELQHALNGFGLYPCTGEIEMALDDLQLALPLPFHDFGLLSEHLRRVGCAGGRRAVPHARRGIRYDQLEAMHAALVESGWLQQQCIAYNNAYKDAIGDGTLEELSENLYSLRHFFIGPVTDPDLNAREAIPRLKLLEAGIPEAPRLPCSYSELLNSHGLQVDFFVSHYWGNDLSRTFGALQRCAAQTHVTVCKVSPQDVVFWMCPFAMNQNTLEDELGSSLDSAPFSMAIRKASAGVVVVLDEYARTLRRVWCLFEVFWAQEQGKQLMLLPEAERPQEGDKLRDMLAQLLHDSLLGLSAFNATASLEADKHAIWHRVLDPIWQMSAFSELAYFRRHAKSPANRQHALNAAYFTGFDTTVRNLIATPLMQNAMLKGDGAAAVRFVGLGAKCNVADLNFIAEMQGDLEAFVDLSVLGVRGKGSLAHVMAHNGRDEELRFLLSRGLDADLPMEMPVADTLYQSGLHKGTALHAAASQGHLQCVSALLEHGANPRAASIGGWQPLVWAGWPHPDSAKIAETLLRHRADPLAPKSSAMHAAAGLGNMAVLSLLLAWTNGDTEVRDSEGAVPLHASATGDRADTAQLLLAYGADANARRKDGATPLHRAVYGGRDQIVALLLRHKADLMAKDLQGRTPMELVATDMEAAGVMEMLAQHLCEFDQTQTV